VRPIYHQHEDRIEAHIFVAFLAYCLQVTLKARLKPAAGGITPREVLMKFKTMQMVDVRVPTTDGRELTGNRSLSAAGHATPDAARAAAAENQRQVHALHRPRSSGCVVETSAS